ncbi:MAG: hypothetical protein RL380_1091 [Verrucomicrobiota bacterium]
MPTTGLVIMVASTTDTNFAAPTASGFVSGDEVEVARWNLSGQATAGILVDGTIPLTLSGNWNSADPIAIYWFPTLNINSVAPTNGTPYGFYRDDVGLDGSDPWVTPPSGITYNLAFLTTDTGVGSVATSAGNASLTVAGANANPVAVTDTYTRTSNLSLKIDIASLITNDTDSDGGTISLTGINLTTTNNITLTTNATDIFYPSNAANVNDRFTYTISDGQGGTATGSVIINLVTVTGTNSVLTLQLGVPSTGTNTLRFAGVPGFSYISQYATNVAGPWVNYATNTAAANGLWTNLDRFATSPQRFYRAQY